jgi:pimeloyl-ACP methyl ester carboxylesterase
MRDGGLSFVEAGSGGPPMVFVHGWSCNRSHMRGLFQHFAVSRRVLSPDLPGHGETPLRDVPVTFAGFSQALAQFCAAHDLRNATLVGHSMGGVLAIHAAAMCPDRVTRVVNLDGALPLRPEALGAYAQLFADVRRNGFRATVEPFLRKAFFLPQEAGAEADAIVASMMSSAEDVAVQLLGQFPTIDAAAALAACRVPVLYVGSSHPRFDESAVGRLRPDIWIARTAVSGHFVQVFALPQVVAMIEQFLGGFPPRA